jgi:tetratricopeptide (TPR) repeat protein
MGIALLNQRRYRDAIKYFQDALRINPNYEEARLHLAAANRLLSEIR